MSLLGLALTVLSFAFPQYPVGFLSFYFFILWLLWMGCVFIKFNKKTLKLILLWAIIDVSILIMFLSITSSVGDASQSQGTDLIWGLAYLPITFPTGVPIAYFSPTFLTTLASLSAFARPWLGKAYVPVIADWLQFSIIAAIQLILILLTTWFVERRQHRMTASQVQ